MTGRSRAQDVARLFDGQRLTVARHLAGLRKNALADLIGRTPTAVAAYESGLKKPAAATVASLAVALGVNPEFFLVAPDLSSRAVSSPHFRSLRSTTQAARDRARAYGLMVYEIIVALERHVEFPDLDIPAIPVDLDTWKASEPEEVAREVRRRWSVPEGPINHVVRMLENKGIFSAFTSWQIAAIDAYSFSSDSHPLVLLNPTKNDYYRQRWDVAHELGHLVMHADAEPGSRDAEEQAHRFAAEFLMPAAEILDLLPSRADWRCLQDLKERWGVSLQALLYRSRQLGVMPERAYKNSMTTISARGWRRQEPGRAVLVEQPSLLPKAVEVLGQVGLDARQLADECRVPLSLFRVATSRVPIHDSPGEGAVAQTRLAVVPDATEYEPEASSLW